MFGRITRRESLLSGVGLAIAGIIPSAAGPRAESEFASPMERAASLHELESLARARMQQSVWDRVSSGAGDEITLRWNREAYDRIRLRPRVLVNVSKLDTRIKLLGQELPFPILLAPTGSHGFVHPEGELATARGAGAAGATMVVSSGSSFPIQEIARAATGPFWSQLLASKASSYGQIRSATRDYVKRAEDAGCRALCVTVDDPITGYRDRALGTQAALPPREDKNGPASSGAKFVPPGKDYTPLLPDMHTWEDIAWLRSIARVPVLLKGVLNPDDADRAVQVGVSGLLVSNHGARQLDTVPATIDALPLVVERVAGRVPVLVDGGIRRGTDVLKALALGASAVLIGRPYVYGLAVGGADGVSRAVNILRTEFELAMALSGRPSIQSIDRSVLWPG
jgi:4-hydroxymandelate oxidase